MFLISFFSFFFRFLTSHGRPPFVQVTRSKIEIVNVNNFSRSLLYEQEAVLASPTWSSDGTVTINRGGSLFQIKPKSSPELLLSVPLKRITNYYGYSSDGKSLAYSNADIVAYDSALARIYLQPVRPGRTRLLTAHAPSFFGAFARDGASIVFATDISSKAGKRIMGIHLLSLPSLKETTLLDTLEGGTPDFSSDGNFIYYSSSRGGVSKIWRMRKDGTGSIKITKGDGADWFPHPSPDGRFIAYLSYPAEDDHTAFKDVNVMLLDINSGYARTIARIKGGDGSMNAPCWSPDSRRFSFVSYTLLQ